MESGAHCMTREPAEQDDLQPLDAAVEAALTANHRDFLRFLTQRLGDADTAQDVLQQFYLRALSRASDLRRRASIVSWLYRLLNSTLVDYTRRDTTRRRQEAAFAREQNLSRADPELETTVCLCLYKLLPTLKPEYAEVLWRVDLLEAPRQEVARALGLTVNNVTVRIHRARQAMKRALLLSCETCPEHGFLRCACDLPNRRAAWPTSDRPQSPCV
jgi:RNA polymerase sigma factor (sigma-70 family)